MLTVHQNYTDFSHKALFKELYLNSYSGYLHLLLSLVFLIGFPLFYIFSIFYFSWLFISKLHSTRQKRLQNFAETEGFIYQQKEKNVGENVIHLDDKTTHADISLPIFSGLRIRGIFVNRSVVTVTTDQKNPFLLINSKRGRFLSLKRLVPILYFGKFKPSNKQLARNYNIHTKSHKLRSKFLDSELTEYLVTDFIDQKMDIVVYENHIMVIMKTWSKNYENIRTAHKVVLEIETILHKLQISTNKKEYAPQFNANPSLMDIIIVTTLCVLVTHL